MINLPFNLFEIEETRIEMPHKEEVDDLVRRYNSYSRDEMVLFKDWAGDAFQTLFNGIVKELAEKNEVDQWDYFACFLHKLFRANN